MKILLVHNFYRIRGGEDWHVEQLEKMLRKNGHEVETYFRSSNEIENFSIIQALCFPINFLYSLSSKKEIERIISDFRPDLVHVHNVFPLISISVYAACEKLRVPVVQSIHNYRLMCLNGLFMLENGKVCEKCASGNFVNGAIRRCYQRSFLNSLWMAFALTLQRWNGCLWRRASIFVCPTSFVRMKLEEAGCPSEKIREVSYFVPDNFESRNEVYGNPPYALYLGRLSQEKGIETMLAAFEKMPDIALKIVGGGPMAAFVESRIKSPSLSHVKYLGYVGEDQKKQLLEGAACLIFPSECYETTGITMLESFQVGTPVIGSRFGRREFFIKDSENGWLFEVGSAESLREAVKKVFSSSAHGCGMRKKARQTFVDKFSEVIAHQGLMNCYEAALNNSWKLSKL